MTTAIDTTLQVAVLQENLHKALRTVKPFIPRRSYPPILSHVKLDSHRGLLRLQATDFDTSISVWVGAKIDQDGSVALWHRDLADYVASLPDYTVRLDGSKLECGGSVFEISDSLPAADFPRMPHVAADGSTCVAFAPEHLIRAVNYVESAAASDESRPVYTGVYCEFGAETATLTAADGYRLSTIAIPQTGSATGQILVPVKAMRLIAKMLKSQKVREPITISANQTHVSFTWPLHEVVVRLIDGTFPNYQQIIPQHPYRLTLDTVRLKALVKNAAVVARSGSGVLRFEAQDGKLVVSARSDDTAVFRGEMPAEIEGDPQDRLRIAFKQRHLLDILDIMGESVTLHLYGTDNQAKFTSPGIDGCTVVMPMFVSWE